MLTYTVELEVFWSESSSTFIYVHALYMQAAKALVNLCIKEDLPEPSLLGNVISNDVAF